MKKLLLVLALAQCALSSFAQPVITAATFNIVPGDYLVYRQDYITDSVVFPGIETSGAALTWDYSTLYGSSNTYGHVFASSSTPYYDSFSSANVAAYIIRATLPYPDTLYEYYIANSSMFKSIGTYSNIYQYNYGTALTFKFPMQYGDMYTDSTVSCTSSSDTSCTIDTNPAEIDAYGTLILPSGTYPNTLRLKISETNFTRYYWIAPYAHFVLLYAGINTGAGAVPLSTEFSYTTAWPTSIGDIQHTLYVSVSPNPATDQLNVSVPLLNENGGLLTLTDISGRVVYSSDLSLTEDKITINTSGMPAGIYLLKLRSGNGIATQKISIMH